MSRQDIKKKNTTGQKTPSGGAGMQTGPNSQGGQVHYVGDEAGGTGKGSVPKGNRSAGGVIPGAKKQSAGKVPANEGAGPRVATPGKRSKPASVRRIGTR